MKKITVICVSAIFALIGMPAKAVTGFNLSTPVRPIGTAATKLGNVQAGSVTVTCPQTFPVSIPSGWQEFDNHGAYTIYSSDNDTAHKLIRCNYKNAIGQKMTLVPVSQHSNCQWIQGTNSYNCK